MAEILSFGYKQIRNRFTPNVAVSYSPHIGFDNQDDFQSEPQQLRDLSNMTVTNNGAKSDPNLEISGDFTNLAKNDYLYVSIYDDHTDSDNWITDNEKVADFTIGNDDDKVVVEFDLDMDESLTHYNITDDFTDEIFNFIGGLGTSITTSDLVLANNGTRQITVDTSSGSGVGGRFLWSTSDSPISATVSGYVTGGDTGTPTEINEAWIEGTFGTKLTETSSFGETHTFTSSGDQLNVDFTIEYPSSAHQPV